MKKFFVILTILLISAFAVSAICEELNVDKEILKRTPTIDGKILQGEWDIFYSIETESDTIMTFTNWDRNNLYLGCACNSIESVAFVVDLNADGWTVGDDNYLITTNENSEFDVLKVVKTSEEGISLVAITVPENSKIHAEQSLINGKTNFEMTIPVGLLNKKNFDNGKININFSIKCPDAEWTTFDPKDVTDNTLGCSLVNHKAFALDPLTIDFYLTREKSVPGETIDGKVKIKNTSKEPVVIKELIMAGEGLSEDIVSSYKIKVGEIKPGKTFEREYHTKILDSTTLGAKVLGCEMYTDQMKVGAALRSFEIINQASFLPYVPKEVCYTNDKVIRLGVKVVSNSEKKLSTGYASVAVPEGWEIEGNNRNKFRIMGYNKYTDIIFRMTPPLGAIGHFKIPVIVNMNDVQETVICDFDIVQTK